MHRALLISCLCFGCGGASQAPAAAARPSELGAARAASQPAPPEAELGMPDVMEVHFAYVTAARDAIIGGRLEDVRPALLALSATPATSDVPVDWLPWLADVQAAAREGALPPTLTAAATSVATLANACGDCHRSTRSGEGSAAHHAPRYDPEDLRGLEEKMARHQFSADALWLGLTGPEHQAWSAGAEALMNIRVPGMVDAHGKPLSPDRRPSGEGSLQGASDPRLPDQNAQQVAEAGSVDLDAALRELRELGRQADQARTASEKQVVFAQLITRCGSCHAALGLDLSAVPAPAADPAHKRVVISADKIVITEQIQFDFNTATIKPESNSLLDELASVIRSEPQLRKISIEGHTDSVGDEAYNLKLSRHRAAAVLRSLIERGVELKRLRATGFGEQRPIASNDDEAGREANRRVELLITEQAALRRTYDVDPRTGAATPQ